MLNDLGPVEKVSQPLNEMTKVSRIGTTVRFRDVFLRGSFYGPPAAWEL